MKTQNGWPFNAEAFTSGLIKKGDLIKYDGPLLSHYISRSNKRHYLFSWIDYDEVYNRWLVFETSLVHLFDYLTNAKSLSEIFKEPYNDKIIILNTDASGICSNALLVPREDIISDYQFEDDSYYELTMPAKYEEYFADVSMRNTIGYAMHMQYLRAMAVRFRLAPFENRFASTVSSNDIGSFLQKVTRSFKSYVEARFLISYSSMYSKIEQALQDLNKVLNVIEPRSVFSQHGSFEIDLAVDILTITQVKSEIIDWQRNVLQEYKLDVFDSNVSVTGERPQSLEGATDEQMRAIFSPIISIANNQNYYVQTRSEQQREYQTLRRISKPISKKLAPTKIRSEDEPRKDEPSTRTALASILVELQEGQDIRTLSLTELRRAMISVSTGDRVFIPLSGFRTAEGNDLYFTEPIEVDLSRIGELYQANYEPLDIAVLGVSARTALDAFQYQLRNLYSRFLINIEDRQQGEGLRSEKEGRVLNAFGELFS